MFQNLFLKKMLKSKLKGMSGADQEKVIAMVEKNPELFNTIAKETQEKVKQGQDQMAAAMEVMQKYSKELRDLV